MLTTRPASNLVADIERYEQELRSQGSYLSELEEDLELPAASRITRDLSLATYTSMIQQADERLGALEAANSEEESPSSSALSDLEDEEEDTEEGEEKGQMVISITEARDGTGPLPEGVSLTLKKQILSWNARMLEKEVKWYDVIRRPRTELI